MLFLREASSPWNLSISIKMFGTPWSGLRKFEVSLETDH